jgi:hypothetical protein
MPTIDTTQKKKKTSKELAVKLMDFLLFRRCIPSFFNAINRRSEDGTENIPSAPAFRPVKYCSTKS